MQFGGSFTQADLWINNQNMVPTIEFDIASGDPAAALFTTEFFPNASGTQLNDASDLYAVLVGRVEEIVATARLNEETDEYVYLGLGRQRAQLREYGLFVADSWRMRPSLTVNLGLRYALQSPFYPLNNSYSTATLDSLWGVSGVGNLFRPESVDRRQADVHSGDKGTRAYNTDKNNFAPSIGFAWTPNLKSSFFRSFLGGDGDSVLRAGYSLAYNRPGMSDFNTVIDDNPGVDYVADRNHTVGNLGTPGSILFRDRAALGAPNFPLTRQYPMTDTRDQDIHVFDPNLQTPYAQTWTVGWQRKVSTNMSAEIRYVGTRADQLWTDFNFNEVNIVENGFLDEFRLAQQNLRANVAAGRGANFRYAGPGTGTGAAADLPRLLHRHGRESGQRCGALLERAVRGHDVRQSARDPQSAAAPGRQCARRAERPRRQCAARGTAGELPGRQSGSARRRAADHQRRLHALQRPAAAAQAADG